MSRGTLMLFTVFNLIWAAITALALALLVLLGTGQGPEIGGGTLSRMLLEAIPFALAGPGLALGATWLAWRMHRQEKSGLTVLCAALPGALALIGLTYLMAP
jgi:hypothetical protein